ncbi:MAG: SDR family oxidoreductase [Promethearchaeota archaeon]
MFNQKDKREPLFVTGAASGIGKMISIFLGEKGHLVYASDIDEKGLRMMENLPNITTMKVDVTNPKDIKQAVNSINEEGRGLYGLVNNAGFAELGPLVETHIEELHRLFNVNVFGVHRITNALFPFLVESKGRIVNIGSVSGVFSSKFWGAYSMSKHAIEAYNDSLTQDVKKFNIKVSIIEPGAFKTNIAKRSLSTVNRIKIDPKSRFKDEINVFANDLEEKYGENSPFPTPERVVDAVYDALFSKSPKRRYLVASQEETEYTIKTAIARIIQLNQNHKYSYDKETLLSMVNNAYKP